MTVHPSKCATVLLLALSAAGCGTPKDKTAPCKRPANLSSYALEPRADCGPMRLVNSDPAVALQAIEMLQAQ